MGLGKSLGRKAGEKSGDWSGLSTGWGAPSSKPSGKPGGIATLKLGRPKRPLGGLGAPKKPDPERDDD